jgi:hypothetical protein
MDISKHIKNLGLDKLIGLQDKDDLIDDQVPKSSKNKDEANLLVSESSSSMIKALTGSIGVLGDFYFPPDLIGGTCPRIPGEEEEIVWNAAAEACDTERVHVVWQSFDNRIWYLAVKSSELASKPNSWCPLSSLLPSLKDAGTPPVCYTYFGEEIAVLMIVMPDGLQVFRGTGPVVRAKAERTARELGNAPIVNLDPDKIEGLTPIPWYSVSLFEDRARRILATLSVLAAIFIAGMAFLVWLTASMSLVASKQNLAAAIERNQQKSMDLVKEAESTRSSPMREQIAKFLAVNDGLLSLNGFLDVYEIKDTRARWRAVVPPSATADRITAIGGKNIEATDKGVAIGNDAEIQFEADKEKR